MDDTFQRIWSNLVERASGPFHMRLWIQPAVALYFGFREGIRDAKRGRSAYFLSIFTDRTQRRPLLREGWKSIAKVFAVALAIDVVFQIIALRFVYPGEAFSVAFVLAILPYLVTRPGEPHCTAGEEEVVASVAN